MQKQKVCLRFILLAGTAVIFIMTSVLNLQLSTNEAMAAAAVSPIAVSIVPPVQFPSDEFSVTGLRLSALWGHHRDLYGIDLGVLGNITDQTFTGIGLSGLANMTHGMTTIIALQAAGLANVNTQKTDVYGVQVAGAINWNSAQSKVVGLQLAILSNLSPNTTVYGAQIGIYNRAQEVYGFQIGVVNLTKNLHGIQIGLVNFNETGIFGVSPILNAGW
ncbi:hypothetical protein BH10BDE1_BH10BDE1_03700 [soil metagenome]